MSKRKILLSMSTIEKRSGDAQVLKKVDMEVTCGEVHVLMGENGARKSTLIRILIGAYSKDGGSITFSGKACEINSRSDAQKLGIGVIYQELSLIPTLSVMQNVMFGKEKSGCGFPKTHEMKKKVGDLIEYHDFNLQPNAIMETLSIAQRQTVEILKALSEDSSLIIMDEPAVSLSSKESEALLGIISRLREKGVSILYISHRLEEVFRLTDRLTVLRDGRKAAVPEKEQINPLDVIKMTIGKELNEATVSRCLHRNEMESVLEVRSLSRKGTFPDISFTLYRGEILGIGGLVGAGRTEALRCIFGADSYDGGKILFQGRRLSCHVSETIAKGFGLAPEDRRNQGSMPLLSIERNTAVPNYDPLSEASNVNRAEEKKIGIDVVRRLDIRPTDSQLLVGNLSGGNQQKVVIGKWLVRDLRVLLTDEPIVGIDIGAKDEIYKILDNLAEQGISILLVSSDLQESLRVSYRILVFRKGYIQKESDSGVTTQEDILMAASGIDTAKKEKRNA